MAPVSLVQASTAATSFTGANFSLVTIQANGVEAGLMKMAGGNFAQAVRAFQTTLHSGGYGRLESSLKSVDFVVSKLVSGEIASGNREHLGFCEPVLKSLVVRGKCVGFSRLRNPMTVVNFSPPDDLHSVTRRILAVSALWVEIIGSQGLGDFITECVKHVVLVPDELLTELSRMCNNLADDLYKSGLGIFHDGQELSKRIGDEVKSKLKEDSGLMQPTKCELFDLLWALHIDAYKPGAKYVTNDKLVYFIYSILESEFTESFPLQLCYEPGINRFHLKNLLPVYKRSGGSSLLESEPWLVPCTFHDFWELMYLHNRPFIGNSIGELDYQEKVRSMQEKLMKHTSMSPTVTEDRVLCSVLSFDSASVPIRDKILFRATQKACKMALHSELTHFAAQVASSENFFTSEELKLAESVERGSSEMRITRGGKYDPEENLSKSLDFKERTIALLMLQTIVMKSVENELHDKLQLFTPAIYATSQDLRNLLAASLDSGLTIQLWRIILVSAWFIEGKDTQYKTNKKRGDIRDCVGIMGPRATVLIAGLLNGSDDIVANNKLWICNGPVPDLPSTSSGLILIDSTFEPMTNHLLPKTFDMDVTPAPPDLDAPVLDLGPSYSSDVSKIRSWVKSGGSSIGFFNPVVAMSQMLTGAVTCRCASRRGLDQDGLFGVYKGWPVKMSELVDPTGSLRSSVAGGTATKLILMTRGDQTWRFCLAGVYDTPVISGDCARCAEEKAVEVGISPHKPVIIL